MSNVSRIGDIAVGICCCHSDPPCVPWVGICASGAGTVITEGNPTTRIGDIFVGCHVGIVASGANTVIAEDSPVARIGDSIVGCPTGTIVTGAGKTFAE